MQPHADKGKRYGIIHTDNGTFTLRDGEGWPPRTDDLTQQSDETIAFIASLVGQIRYQCAASSLP